MYFAALLTDLQLILLGLAVLVIAFVLYRGIALSQRSGRRDFAAEDRAGLNAPLLPTSKSWKFACTITGGKLKVAWLRHEPCSTV